MAQSYQPESRLPGVQWTRRFAAHLEANGVDLDRERPTFGRVLAVDPEEQRYVGDVEADALMRGAYRDGFQVPRKG